MVLANPSAHANSKMIGERPIEPPCWEETCDIIVLAGVAAALLCTAAHAADKEDPLFRRQRRLRLLEGGRSRREEGAGRAAELQSRPQISRAVLGRDPEPPDGRSRRRAASPASWSAPVDPEDRRATRSTRSAARPSLFTTDSDAPNSKRIAYIGSSNVDAGKQAGELMMKALPERRQVHGLRRPAGRRQCARAHRGRQGRDQGHRRSSWSTCAADDIDQARAKRNVEDTLTAHPDINCMVGFYSYNTPQHLRGAEGSRQARQDHDHRLRRGSGHARRRQGRHDRRHRRAAALRVGLPGHEGHGQVHRRRQVLHPGQQADHHPDQDHREGQCRRLLGRAEGSAQGKK